MYLFIYLFIYYYCCYRFFVLDYFILLMCVGMCACMFSFFSFPFISFRFGLFTFVALGNRGSPREVISVTCESSWLLRHAIIYINYIYFTYIFSLYIYGCALWSKYMFQFQFQYYSIFSSHVIYGCQVWAQRCTSSVK